VITPPKICGVTFYTAGGACPFQAEGTIDGAEFYFRYRRGHATLSASDKTVGESFGDALDGFLDDAEFAALFTRLAAAWRVEASRPVVEGEQTPVVLDRDRYTADVTALINRFAKALAGSIREDYPIHLARLRGSLLDLGDGPALADQAESEATNG
jgi:hypothetical protein